MKTMDVFRNVRSEGVKLVRPIKGKQNEYDVKGIVGGNKKGWVYLDGLTASRVISVYNALSDVNKSKLENMDIMRIIDVCLKIKA